MIPSHPFRPLFHKRLAISWGKSPGELSRTTRRAHTCVQIDMPHNGILKWNHLERACEKLSLGTFSHHVTRRLRWQAVARRCVHFHLEKWDSPSRTPSSRAISLAVARAPKCVQDLSDFLLLFRRSSFTKSHLWNSFRSDPWTCECVWGSRDECDWIKLHSVREGTVRWQQSGPVPTLQQWLPPLLLSSDPYWETMGLVFSWMSWKAPLSLSLNKNL